jgi:Ca-activated chloride channel family protein
MNADDFEDDTKDGGETGAGQQVTVLYELEFVNENTTGSDLKYQGDRELKEEANSNEILTLSIRYKEPDEDESKIESFAIEETNDKISSDFNFVCGVAELSMILIDSDYAGTATLESAYDLIKENSMEDEKREELARLIEIIDAR